MLDSQNNATLVPENTSFYFKRNVETQASLLNASIMVWSFNFDFFYFSFPFWCFLDEIWIFRTLFLEEMISLHPLQTTFLLWQIKFSPGNCLTRSYNGTFVVSLFDLELSVKGLVYVVRQNFLLWVASFEKMAWHWRGGRHLVCTSAWTASES